MDGSHDASPKYGDPRGISTSQGTRQLAGCWWALRVHCVGARCSVKLALLLGFFGVP